MDAAHLRGATRKAGATKSLARAHVIGHGSADSEVAADGRRLGGEREFGPDVPLGAAEEFFLESLAAFEMVQRGFREARDNAALQRRHAEMLRQLSEFLADASLALQASASFEQMLQRVCEQARELLSAPCCFVTIGEAPQIRFGAASHPEDECCPRPDLRPRSPAPHLPLA